MAVLQEATHYLELDTDNTIQKTIIIGREVIIYSAKDIGVT